MKKKLLSVFIAVMLTLTACGSTPASKDVQTEAAKEVTFTIDDCFKKKTAIVDSEESLKSYLNSRKGALIRVNVTERAYAGEDTSNPDESSTKSLMSYEVYAGHITNSCNEDLFEVRAYPDPKRAFDFEDVFGSEYAISEGDDLYDVYSKIVEALSINDCYRNMFASDDYKVSEEDKNRALSEKSYRVISQMPQNEIFNTVFTNKEYKDITFCQVDHVLSADEENDTAYPSNMNVLIQYKDAEGIQKVHSISLSLVTFDDLDTIGEKLTQACACGDSCLSACGCD